MYSISVNLKGKVCLVVGGGAVAERRTAGLLEEGASVVLVSPDVTPKLSGWAVAEELEWRCDRYSSAHLDGMFLVIAATNSRDVNKLAAQEAQEQGLLVCCADGFADGNFTTPAVVKRGELIVTVTTGGQSPTLTAVLRQRLEREFGLEWAVLTSIFGRLRDRVKSVGDEPARRRVVQRVLEDRDVQDLIRLGQTTEAEARVLCLLLSSE